MELTQIRYALMIAKYRNFSKAAEQLYITQPTLSQQIRRLEEELGFPLFKRSTRNVTLTNEGRLFINYAEPVMADYNILSQQMEKLKLRSLSRLTLGVLPTFSHLNIPTLVRDFQDLHPETNLFLEFHSSNDLIQLMLNDHLDIIIANITPIQKANLEKETEIYIFSSDHICVLLNEKNPLSQKDFLTLNDIQGEPIIMLGKKSSIYRQIDFVFKSAGIVPEKIYPCPEIHTMLGLIQSNTGIGFLSSRVASEYVHAPVVSTPFSPELITSTAVMYMKNSANATVANSFLEYIRSLQ